MFRSLTLLLLFAVYACVDATTCNIAITSITVNSISFTFGPCTLPSIAPYQWGYDIQYGVQGGTVSTLHNVSPGSITLSSLQRVTTYSWYVVAYDGSGQYDNQNFDPVNATTLADTCNVAITAITFNSVSFTFGPCTLPSIAPYQWGYDIQYGVQGGTVSTLHDVSPGSITLPSLQSLTTYSWYVVAYDGSGQYNNQYFDPASATTLPNTCNVAIATIASNSISFTFGCTVPLIDPANLEFRIRFGVQGSGFPYLLVFGPSGLATLPTLQPETLYNWYVVAHDKSGMYGDQNFDQVSATTIGDFCSLQIDPDVTSVRMRVTNDSGTTYTEYSGVTPLLGAYNFSGPSVVEVDEVVCSSGLSSTIKYTRRVFECSPTGVLNATDQDSGIIYTSGATALDICAPFVKHWFRFEDGLLDSQTNLRGTYSDGAPGSTTFVSGTVRGGSYQQTFSDVQSSSSGNVFIPGFEFMPFCMWMNSDRIDKSFTMIIAYVTNFGYDSSQGRLQLDIEADFSYKLYDTKPLLSQTWTHVCVTFGVNDPSIRLYRDGALRSSTDWTVSYTADSVQPDQIDSIGGAIYSGQVSRFEGMIDDLMFFDIHNIPSYVQIQEIYRSQRVYDPLVFIGFRMGLQQILPNDKSNVSLSLVGAQLPVYISVVVDDIRGHALTCGPYGHDDRLNFDVPFYVGDGLLSISAWVTFPPQTVAMTIISLMTSDGTPVLQWTLGVGGDIYIQFAGNTQVSGGQIATSPNRWVHVAVVIGIWDQTTYKSATFYVDSVSTGTFFISSLMDYSHEVSAYTQPGNNKMTDLSIWKRALTSDEIVSLYNTTLYVTQKALGAFSCFVDLGSGFDAIVVSQQSVTVTVTPQSPLAAIGSGETITISSVVCSYGYRTFFYSLEFLSCPMLLTDNSTVLTFRAPCVAKGSDPCSSTAVDTDTGVTITFDSSKFYDELNCHCPSPLVSTGPDTCACPMPSRYASGTCTTLCNYYIYEASTGYISDVFHTGHLSLDVTNSMFCSGEPDKFMTVRNQVGTLRPLATECECVPGYTWDRTLNQCVTKPCMIRLAPSNPSIDVYLNGASTPTRYINADGFVVIPVARFETAFVNKWCGDNENLYLNTHGASVQFTCSQYAGDLQLPGCVKQCGQYQDWYGNQCVCQPGTDGITCQTCGPNSNCNSRGFCISTNTTAGNSFCSCRENYAGRYCSDPPVQDRCISTGEFSVCDLDYNNVQCDCGVQWLTPVLPSPQLSFRVSTEIGLYTSYYDMDLQINFPSLLPNYLPVVLYNQYMGWIGAAKYACYSDPECDGFTWDVNTNRFTPVKFTTGLWTTPSWLTGNTYEIHRIERKSLYNCTSMVPDYYWYYFESGYRAEIEANFLQDGICAAPDACYPGTKPQDKSVPNLNPWYQLAIKHWKTIGHKRRYSPNPTCVLSPTISDPATRCATVRPGCEQTSPTAPPCGGTGYCTYSSVAVRDPKPYRCSCKPYSSADAQGDFALLPKYMGYACQYETATFCTTQGKNNVTNFCNGMEYRCQPTSVKADTGNRLSSGIQDYFPACNCDSFTSAFPPFLAEPSSQFTGAYCNTSKCADPVNCDHMGDGLSKCINLNAGQPESLSNWQCSCGYTATGSKCQESSALCINPDGDLHVACTGQGKCMPSGLASNLYGSFPNYQSGSVWCNCTGGTQGHYCWDVACTTSVLFPGHGTCNNLGQKTGCFPVFGGNACEVKMCEQSGGTTLDSNTCSCPASLGLTKNHVVDNGTDPTCWPMCPETSTGQVCGASVINTCTLTKSGSGVKSALCQCDSAQGWLPYNVIDPVLGNVTSCYQFCSENGVLASGWSPTNLLPCVCTAASGTVSTPEKPRCDVDKCEPNGHWDGYTCRCNPLFYGELCQYNTCDNPFTTDVTEGIPDGAICRCGIGYTYNNTFRLQDCNATECGKWGSPNTDYIPGLTPLKSRCTCKGIFVTAPCSSAVSCTPYCTSSYCENGGTPYTPVGTVTPTLCTCPFPFKTLQPGGYCSLTQCSISQRIPQTSQGRCDTHWCTENGSPGTGGCVCINNWRSSSKLNTTSNGLGLCTVRPCCDITPCKNGGVWNPSTLKCTCTNSSYAGDMCEVSLTSIGTTTSAPIVCGVYGTRVANSFCICDHLWSGTTCTVSPCVHGTFNPTSLLCDCATNYVGSRCDVYIEPPTTVPPTTTPPTTAAPTTSPPPSSTGVDQDFESVCIVLVAVWITLVFAY
jgi:hypothetical protein